MKTLVRHMREVLDLENGETYYMPKKDYVNAVDNEGAMLALTQNGGYTEALAYTDDGQLIASAKAECSRADTFSRKIGRKVALNRLNLKLEAVTANEKPIRLRDVISNDYSGPGFLAKPFPATRQELHESFGEAVFNLITNQVYRRRKTVA